MEQAWENVYITQTFPSSPATDENLKWIGNEELYNHMNWKQEDVTSHIGWIPDLSVCGEYWISLKFA